MPDRDETKPAAAGRLVVVIFRDEFGDAIGQFGGKGRPGLRGRETNLGVEGERRDAAVLGARAGVERSRLRVMVRAATATTYEALKRSRADSGVGPSVPRASGLMTKDRAVARRIRSVQFPLRRSSMHSSSPHCSSAFR